MVYGMLLDLITNIYTIFSRCIPSSKRCDGMRDCIVNAEDEAGCFNKTCDESQYKCKSGLCIAKVWVCDDDNDCLDMSDEGPHCFNRTCLKDSFRVIISTIFYNFDFYNS